MRSPELRRDTSPRSEALLRSSVLTVSTARPMPALSFSIETCIATIPIRPKADDDDPRAAAHEAVHRAAARDVDRDAGDAQTRTRQPPAAASRSGGRGRGERCAGPAGLGVQRGARERCAGPADLSCSGPDLRRGAAGAARRTADIVVDRGASCGG